MEGLQMNMILFIIFCLLGVGTVVSAIAYKRTYDSKYDWWMTGCMISMFAVCIVAVVNLTTKGDTQTERTLVTITRVENEHAYFEINGEEYNRAVDKYTQAYMEKNDKAWFVVERESTILSNELIMTDSYLLPYFEEE